MVSGEGRGLEVCTALSTDWSFIPGRLALPSHDPPLSLLTEDWDDWDDWEERSGPREAGPDSFNILLYYLNSPHQTNMKCE